MPIGAWLFTEYIDPRALVFALVAFGGLALVLFSAPPNGDASLEGNVFGVIAMLLLDRLRRVDAALPPRHGRRHVHGDDLSDRGAVAVLPLAIANGDVFGHERHGVDVHADPHAPHRASPPRG